MTNIVTVYLVNPEVFEAAVEGWDFKPKMLRVFTQCNQQGFEHLNNLKFEGEDLDRINFQTLLEADESLILDYKIEVDTSLLPKCDVSFSEVYETLTSPSVQAVIDALESHIEEYNGIGYTTGKLEEWVEYLDRQVCQGEPLMRNLAESFNDYIDNLRDQCPSLWESLCGYIDMQTLRRDFEANYTSLEIDGEEYFTV